MMKMKRRCTLPLLAAALLLSLSAKGQDMDSVFSLPDTLFNTPTLSIAEDRFASWEEILSFIKGLDEECDQMSVRTIGSSTEGRAIPLVKFSRGDGKKLRVFFQGAIHGNERASSEGMFALMNFLARTDEGQALLEKLDIYIIPVANVDGYLANRRASSTGLDLNRDQTKFSDPLSVTLKRAFMEIDPDVAVDFHEYNPVRGELTKKGLISYYDVLFLPSGHPNVNGGIRDASLRFLRDPAARRLTAKGLSHFNYFTIDSKGEEMALVMGARSPQSSSTSYCLSNAVGMLVEIRGIGLGRKYLERRTLATLTIARSVLSESYRNASEIISIVKAADKAAAGGRGSVYPAFHSGEKRMDVEFLDMKTAGKRTLGNVLVRDALSPEIDIRRPRPRAYILEASQEKAAGNLRTLGLEVKTLSRPRTFKVESFKVTSAAEAPALWEKIHRLSVKTEVFKEKRTFPEGAFIVYMKQKNSAFAPTLLEPESENGLVDFRVIGAAEGDTLAVHRLMR